MSISTGKNKFRVISAGALGVYMCDIQACLSRLIYGGVGKLYSEPSRNDWQFPLPAQSSQIVCMLVRTKRETERHKKRKRERGKSSTVLTAGDLWGRGRQGERNVKLMKKHVWKSFRETDRSSCRERERMIRQGFMRHPALCVLHLTQQRHYAFPKNHPAVILHRWWTLLVCYVVDAQIHTFSEPRQLFYNGASWERFSCSFLMGYRMKWSVSSWLWYSLSATARIPFPNWQRSSGNRPRDWVCIA